MPTILRMAIAAVLTLVLVFGTAAAPEAEARVTAPRPAARVAVLLYHDVQPKPYSPFVVTPERLAGDLRWFLERGWRPLTLGEFAAWMGGKLELTGDCFLLTFDDGYLGWAEHGYPILRELGIPAVQFVVTGDLGRADWSCGPPKLGVDHLEAIAAEGLVVFADHTFDLHRMPNGIPVVRQVPADLVAKDLDASRAILRALTGSDPLAVAWPYGVPPAQDVARERYELGFGAEDGFARRGEPHGIPRFGLDWRDPAELPRLFARRGGS